MVYPAILEFINRIQRARGTKSKEFRITIEEANAISLELNKILLNKSPVKEAPKPREISGGHF